jgi:hypothetical protein
MTIVRRRQQESKAHAHAHAHANARAVLEASPMGEWVLIHGSERVGTFDTFEDAASRAVEEFGVGSYLIRTGGASTVTLPASVVFQRAGR